jgi:hypothetical protein
MQLGGKMNQTLAVTKIEAVEEIGPGIFEVRVLLEDASIATLRMNGCTLCSLAEMVSQYATRARAADLKNLHWYFRAYDDQSLR